MSSTEKPTPIATAITAITDDGRRRLERGMPAAPPRRNLTMFTRGLRERGMGGASARPGGVDLYRVSGLDDAGGRQGRRVPDVTRARSLREGLPGSFGGPAVSRTT